MTRHQERDILHETLNFSPFVDMQLARSAIRFLKFGHPRMNFSSKIPSISGRFVRERRRKYEIEYEEQEGERCFAKKFPTSR